MTSRPQRTACIRIANAIAEMQKVVAFVERFGTEHNLPARVVNDLNLCLDELLNNAISYGYGDGASHQIAISLRLDAGAVVAEIEDDAKPFDPRRMVPRPQSRDLKTRARGGLGLRFVNALMDEVDYARSGRYNRTRLIKRLTASAGVRGTGP
jgi:anti-sigma regulatory factor (Ser/Thr protein kinase)